MGTLFFRQALVNPIDTTPKLPFADNYEQAVEYVANRKFRPKISNEIPKSISALIKK
jgi:hypothetical protein